MNNFSTPAGWYADGEGWERRWDGTAWTDERRRTTPPPAAPAPQSPSPSVPQPPSAPPAPQFPPPTGASAAPGAGLPPPPPQQNRPAGPAPTSSYGRIPTAPPGFPGAPQPPQPPTYGAKPAGRNRLWLWATLGLVGVLVVGAGIVLVVVQPWAGEKSEKTAKDPGTDDPKTSSAIHGDLDGDGLGDVKIAIRAGYETVSVITGTSTGDSFDVEELAGDPYTAENTLWFDWNGDGTAEDLTTTYDSTAGNVALTSTDPGLEENTLALPLSTVSTYGDTSIRTTFGDFDGDGNADLLVWGAMDRKVGVFVLAGDGAGTFAEPEQWASIPNTLDSETVLVAGDLDGDGDDDLFAELPSEKLTGENYKNDSYYEDRGSAQLTSSGEDFDVSPVSPVDGYGLTYLVGNFGGEKDLVVSLKGDSFDETLTATASEVIDGRFVPSSGPTVTDDKLGDRDLEGAALSDVDGDGDDDIVYLAKKYDEKKFKDITVLTYDAGSFQPGASWGSVSRCGDDYCDVTFFASSR